MASQSRNMYRVVVKVIDERRKNPIVLDGLKYKTICCLIENMIRDPQELGNGTRIVGVLYLTYNKVRREGTRGVEKVD